MDEGANRSMGDQSLGSFEDTKAIAAEPGVQNQSVTKSGFSWFSKRGCDLRGAGPDLCMDIMGDRGVGVSAGSKKHVQESDILDGVAPGIAPPCAGHDPMGRSDSHSDQSDIGIVMGIESNQPQRGIQTGGGHPNHSEQVRCINGVRKGEREPIKYWNNFFSAPIISNPKLDFYAPSCVDGVPEIHPPDEAVFEGVSMWKGCLVGQFFDKRLPIHVVRATVDKLWGKHEMPEISTTDNGLYLFRFRDMDARDWVMENGPWYIVGRPIILRVWQSGMEMLNIKLTSLPI